MSSSLVLILWPASMLFTAVLSFRVGMWWRTTHPPNRHTVAFVRRHRDDDEADHDEDEYLSDDAVWLPRRPATAKPIRWWSDNDDTEILPQLQDIRPPSRPTPIRRPPWVGAPKKPKRS